MLLGKLNMHEIALGLTNVNPHYGACHNPWNLDRVSGGSSGGSAVALAAGLCLISMGTDTGGSIRVPAALCGVAGFKPTFGRVSCQGVIPLSWNLDHAGPMGRCVEDVARLLQVVAGFDPSDAFCVNTPVDDYLNQLKGGVKGWRVALANDEHFNQADSSVREAVAQAARVFTQLGAHVEEASFPGANEAAQANALIVTSDAAVFHTERLQASPEDFGDDVLQRLRMGATCPAQNYILARRAQVTLRRKFEQFFEKAGQPTGTLYDLLLTPTTPVTAPAILRPDAVEQARQLTRFTSPFNLTGLPALSVPCGFDQDGLPIGLQIVARPWDETSILRAAYAYEQATIWHLSRPTCRWAARPTLSPT